MDICENCGQEQHDEPCVPPTWECIMSDIKTGETMVAISREPFWHDAVQAFEDACRPGGLWWGFRPFVTSVLTD